jgi:peptidoglycan/xylan/chitin deacetylase (PgdA/CDA1 family)
VAAAFVAAAAWAALPAGAAGETKGGGTHADPAEGGALDLVGAALAQRDRDLVVTVRAAERIDPAELAGAGRLCATFAGAAGNAALCVQRRDGAWRLRSGTRAVAGSVGQPRGGTLVVRVRPAVLGLRPGALRWHVAATPASCAGSAAASPGGTAPAATPDCTDRLPASGDRPGRVWRVVSTGCVARGAAQVSRGTAGKAVALTYDDGPAPLTPAFLRELDRLGVPATFFMIGQQVPGSAALVRRMLAAGHELGNHSWNHADLGGGGPGASSQLARTNAAIRRATGFTPCVFRPPYGSTGADLVARTRALGMTSILWSADPLDWRTPGAGAITGRVLAQSGPGAIILSHDGGGSRGQTLAALPAIVSGLRARGYRFTTVSGLLGYRERVTLRR